MTTQNSRYILREKSVLEGLDLRVPWSERPPGTCGWVELDTVLAGRGKRTSEVIGKVECRECAQYRSGGEVDQVELAHRVAVRHLRRQDC